VSSGSLGRQGNHAVGRAMRSCVHANMRPSMRAYRTDGRSDVQRPSSVVRSTLLTPGHPARRSWRSAGRACGQQCDHAIRGRVTNSGHVHSHRHVVRYERSAVILTVSGVDNLSQPVWRAVWHTVSHTGVRSCLRAGMHACLHTIQSIHAIRWLCCCRLTPQPQTPAAARPARAPVGPISTPYSLSVTHHPTQQLSAHTAEPIANTVTTRTTSSAIILHPP